MPFPFEVDFAEVEADLDTYVDEVFAVLESGFLVMPKGDGFVEFPVFDAGYEALKTATRGFRSVTSDRVVRVVMEKPISLIVLRCMLGFTPPEWAYHASENVGVDVPQGSAREIDRSIRLAPESPISAQAVVKRGRIEALVKSACELLRSGVGDGVAEDMIHRLDKADTRRTRAGGLTACRRWHGWVCRTRCFFTNVYWGGRSRAIWIRSVNWSATSWKTPWKTSLRSTA